MKPLAEHGLVRDQVGVSKATAARKQACAHRLAARRLLQTTGVAAAILVGTYSSAAASVIFRFDPIRTTGLTDVSGEITLSDAGYNDGRVSGSFGDVLFGDNPTDLESFALSSSPLVLDVFYTPYNIPSLSGDPNLLEFDFRIDPSGMFLLGSFSATTLGFTEAAMGFSTAGPLWLLGFGTDFDRSPCFGPQTPADSRCTATGRWKRVSRVAEPDGLLLLLIGFVGLGLALTKTAARSWMRRSWQQ